MSSQLKVMLVIMVVVSVLATFVQFGSSESLDSFVCMVSNICKGN